MKNIGFTGVFRLIFRPLGEEIPCFGAVAYSLREKVRCFFLYIMIFLLLNLKWKDLLVRTLFIYLQKDLNFTLKVIGGDLSSIPGISEAIEVRTVTIYFHLRPY